MATAPDPNPDQELRRRLAVVRAVDRFDPRQSQVWEELGALSSKLELQAHYADPEGIVVTGDRFRGVMNLYIMLGYEGGDAFESSEAFPAIFEGHFADSDEAVIDTVQVKTESFFA